MATCSSILAWKIPWTEEPGELQSTGLQSWTWLSARTHTHQEPVRWVTSWERGQVKTLYLIFFSVVLFIHASQIMGIGIHTKNNSVPKLLTWTKVNCDCVSKSRSVMSNSLWLHGYSSWNSPGQNTGVGSWSLLQKSSQPRDQTQVILHCRRILEGTKLTSWVRPNRVVWKKIKFDYKKNQSHSCAHLSMWLTFVPTTSVFE